MTTIRLISHNTPLQWHDCSDAFIARLEEYLLKRRKHLDIWIQYYDGRYSRTAPRWLLASIAATLPTVGIANLGRLKNITVNLNSH